MNSFLGKKEKRSFGTFFNLIKQIRLKKNFKNKKTIFLGIKNEPNFVNPKPIYGNVAIVS